MIHFTVCIGETFSSHIFISRGTIIVVHPIASARYFYTDVFIRPVELQKFLSLSLDVSTCSTVMDCNYFQSSPAFRSLVDNTFLFKLLQFSQCGHIISTLIMSLCCQRIHAIIVVHSSAGNMNRTEQMIIAASFHSVNIASVPESCITALCSAARQSDTTSIYGCMYFRCIFGIDCVYCIDL